MKTIMRHNSGLTKSGLLVLVIVLAAASAGILAVVTLDTTGDKGSGLGEAYDYNVNTLSKIDPNLILYEARSTSGESINTGFKISRAITILPDEQIYIAGDKSIKIFNKNGDMLNEIPLAEEPMCLSVTKDKLYVGMPDHLEVYDHQGKRLSSWESPGERARLTSIDVYKDNVLVADAGNRLVVRYDTTGKVLNYIGEKNKDRNIPGFIIPSPYFDLAVAGDGLLRVVNPGRLKIEAYTLEGDLEFSWGESSSKIEGFIGCCNPVNFTLLADDSVVTCEKGITRVKIYEPMGNFKGVVAGPEQFGGEGKSQVCIYSSQCQSGGFDVATDKQGRVYVLDTKENIIKIFEPKEKSGE